MSKNYFFQLPEFMKRWDQSGLVVDASSIELKKSLLGNFNSDGTPQCSGAKSFVKNDPIFLHAIEEGVKELVLLLIEKFDCITYSSCQGHPATEDVALRQRHVGILPRNPEEYQKLLMILGNIILQANESLRAGSIRIAMIEDCLVSHDANRPCLDLYFGCTDPAHQDYFELLEPAYSLFLKSLKKLPSTQS